ncbi:MAG: hypothetical protein AB2741_04185, partial [Exiguobacterium sp.]
VILRSISNHIIRVVGSPATPFFVFWKFFRAGRLPGWNLLATMRIRKITLIHIRLLGINW